MDGVGQEQCAGWFYGRPRWCDSGYSCNKILIQLIRRNGVGFTFVQDGRRIFKITTGNWKTLFQLHTYLTTYLNNSDFSREIIGFTKKHRWLVRTLTYF